MRGVLPRLERDIRATLSSLWVYVLLNIVFRDIHGLFRPGFVAELVDNSVHGSAVDPAAVLLAAGGPLSVPMSVYRCEHVRDSSHPLRNGDAMGTKARQSRDTATALTVLRLVVRDLTQLFGPLQDGDWDRRTPCPEWTLRDLTEHITGGNRTTISILSGDTSVGDLDE